MRLLLARGTRGSTRSEASAPRGWDGESGSGKGASGRGTSGGGTSGQGTFGQIEDLSLGDREREVFDLVRQDPTDPFFPP